MIQTQPGSPAGIKIVDLKTVVLGPLATQIRGDLGADGLRRPAPRLGEHSREILRELGLGEPEIDTLLARQLAIAVA